MLVEKDGRKTAYIDDKYWIDMNLVPSSVGIYEIVQGLIKWVCLYFNILYKYNTVLIEFGV